MSKIDRILRRFARPDDQAILDENPTFTGRLRIVARIALRHPLIYVLVLAVAGLTTLASGMDVYHRTEMPDFCGACHEMGVNFASWRESLHGSIRCIDCHARPGIGGWLAAKMAGTKQLLTHFTASSIKDIHLEAKHRQIVSEACQRCHAGAVRLRERGGLIMAHEKHLDMGVQCVTCHSGRFAHPTEEQLRGDKPVRVDFPACWACHDGQHTVGSNTAFDALDEHNCVRCHPDAELALQHGAGHPTAKTRRPCLACHDSTARETHFPLPEEQSSVCESCHEIKKDFTSVHAPFEEGDCKSCHRVMSPAHLYRTGPKPQNALCLGCHEEIEAVIKSKKGAKPTAFRDGEDDLHASHAEALGDEDGPWCLSCHDPHGSAAKRGMVALDDPEHDEGTFTANDDGGSCTGSCHEDDEMEYTRE